MVDEGQDPPGDEENDDNRLIIICARVDPRFKDEAVNTKERKILLCIEKQHLSSVMLKRTKNQSIQLLFNHNNYSITFNHDNHRVLTICLTLYRSMNRFEKSFQQFHVWNPVHPPPNYSQIQLYLFSIKILKIILKFNSFWRSNDGINFNQLSFKINKNSISHVINSRLIIVDNVNASSILDNGTSAKKKRKKKKEHISRIVISRNQGFSMYRTQ